MPKSQVEFLENPLDNIGFRRAFEHALKSPGKRYRVGAAIYRRGKFISGGTNSQKTHPQSKRKSHNLCAELCSILAAKGNTRGCSIYVIRIGWSLDLLPINACKHCRAIIEKAGIKTLYEAQNNNKYLVEEL